MTLASIIVGTLFAALTWYTAYLQFRTLWKYSKQGYLIGLLAIFIGGIFGGINNHKSSDDIQKLHNNIEVLDVQLNNKMSKIQENALELYKRSLDFLAKTMDQLRANHNLLTEKQIVDNYNSLLYGELLRLKEELNSSSTKYAGALPVHQPYTISEIIKTVQSLLEISGATISDKEISDLNIIRDSINYYILNNATSIDTSKHSNANKVKIPTNIALVNRFQAIQSIVDEDNSYKLTGNNSVVITGVKSSPGFGVRSMDIGLGGVVMKSDGRLIRHNYGDKFTAMVADKDYLYIVSPLGILAKLSKFASNNGSYFEEDSILLDTSSGSPVTNIEISNGFLTIDGDKGQFKFDVNKLPTCCGGAKRAALDTK